MITIGSLFSGIGGFELGLERAIPNSSTIWQVEKDKYCQSILKKHWPKAKLYNDVTTIQAKELEPPTIVCGGFPCQDLSNAGKMEGIHGKKSGLWWEMHRIIGNLRRKPRVVVLENVANILHLGGLDVLGSLAEIGYDSEWTIIRASDFGANHRRARWFSICYLSDANSQSKPSRPIFPKTLERDASHPTIQNMEKQSINTISMESKRRFKCRDSQKNGPYPKNHWAKGTTDPPFCSVDDGISKRVARLKALGNAIVPQCSQWIGEQIWKSGLLEEV